jgi:ABC-type sugar transport system permease subunit
VSGSPAGSLAVPLGRSLPHGETSRGGLFTLLTLPSALLVGLIIGFPILYALFISFHHVGIRELRTGVMTPAGADNFATVVRDGLFRASLAHTVVFAAASVVLEVGAGLAIALAMNVRAARLGAATRVVMLLPWAVPPVVNGVMWSYVFNSNYGTLNAVLYHLGLIRDYVQWISDPRLAMGAVVAAYVWRTAPFGALLFHAALQSVPEELYEAARVDGGGSGALFRTITLPLLRPVLLVVLVLRTVFAFMVFDEILAITYGGPGDSTWMASWYIYSVAFRYLRFGAGSAAAFLMGGIVAAVALIYILLLRGYEEAA